MGAFLRRPPRTEPLLPTFQGLFEWRSQLIPLVQQAGVEPTMAACLFEIAVCVPYNTHSLQPLSYHLTTAAQNARSGTRTHDHVLNRQIIKIAVRELYNPRWLMLRALPAELSWLMAYAVRIELTFTNRTSIVLLSALRIDICVRLTRIALEHSASSGTTIEA